ncbi:MAG: TlyA family RNA methyltransferase [Synergistetes bacterium]|nr:TlyA family RNA methyltransferase [Synergistota bacterium]
MKKERIDKLLVLKGFFESREKAQRALMAGLVFVNGRRIEKAGDKVPPDAEIKVKGSECPYVSRGGLKLKRALDHFEISLEGKICLDVGASTGGFTDCMLKEGARKVYAVDVGYGQLHWKLRNDPRVILMERTNARYLSRDLVPDEIDFFAIDVSFISVKKILPAVEGLLTEDAEGVILVKPQFEAGRRWAKGGVVKSAEIHESVVRDLASFVLCRLRLNPLDLTYSPIKGPKGNIEFLLYVGFRDSHLKEEMITSVVKEAHEQLGG